MHLRPAVHLASQVRRSRHLPSGRVPIRPHVSNTIPVGSALRGWEVFMIRRFKSIHTHCPVPDWNACTAVGVLRSSAAKALQDRLRCDRAGHAPASLAFAKTRNDHASDLDHLSRCARRTSGAAAHTARDGIRSPKAAAEFRPVFQVHALATRQRRRISRPDTPIGWDHGMARRGCSALD